MKIENANLERLRCKVASKETRIETTRISLRRLDPAERLRDADRIVWVVPMEPPVYASPASVSRCSITCQQRENDISGSSADIS